jgi:hypothetical protein
MKRLIDWYATVSNRMPTAFQKIPHLYWSANVAAEPRPKTVSHVWLQRAQRCLVWSSVSSGAIVRDRSSPSKTTIPDPAPSPGSTQATKILRQSRKLLSVHAPSLNWSVRRSGVVATRTRHQQGWSWIEWAIRDWRQNGSGNMRAGKQQPRLYADHIRCHCVLRGMIAASVPLVVSRFVETDETTADLESRRSNTGTLVRSPSVEGNHPADAEPPRSRPFSHPSGPRSRAPRFPATTLQLPCWTVLSLNQNEKQHKWPQTYAPASRRSLPLFSPPPP